MCRIRDERSFSVEVISKITLGVALLCISLNAFSQQPKIIEGFDIGKTQNAYYIKGDQINNYSLDERSLEGFVTKLIIGELKNDTIRELVIKMYKTVSQNTKDIDELRNQLQIGIDTLLLKDSLQQVEIERLKNNYDGFSKNLNVINQYTTVEKVDSDYVIDFNRLKRNRNLVFESDFHEGLAKVYNGYNSWGFINKHGEFLIDFQFEDAGDFNSGIAPVRKNGWWYYIDKSNSDVSSTFSDLALSFHNGIGLIGKYDYDYHTIKETQTNSPLKLEDYKVYFLVNYDKNRVRVFDTIMCDYSSSDTLTSIYTSHVHFKLIWSNSMFHLFQIKGDQSRHNYGDYILFDYQGSEMLQANFIDIPYEGKVVYKDYMFSVTDYGAEVYDLHRKKVIISEQDYVEIKPFFEGLSIVKKRNNESSIIDSNNSAKLPFRKQKILRISNNKYQVTYNKRKKVIFKIMKSGELKCIEGNCSRYFN